MLNNNKGQEFLVSIIILTYGAEKYIKKCLNSVLVQTYSNIEIIVIDNNSSDETVEIIQDLNIKNQNDNSKFKIIKNKINLGFAAGQNQGIRAAQGKYVLCLNQDAWLDKDYVKNAAAVLEADNKIAAVQGKLWRYDWQNEKILPIIDTKGLVMLKNRRIICEDQGKKENSETKEKIREIFGADGATPVYRRAALEDIKLPIHSVILNRRQAVKDPAEIDRDNFSTELFKFHSRNESKQKFEYFDEDFWMYKEDVDLAWRLRLAGWKAVYAPNCLAYHGRGAGDSATKNYAAILRERRKISGSAKFYSWKNQRLMQIKNETAGNFFKHFPQFIIKEIFSWAYVLIFEEPYGLKSIIKLCQEIPGAYKKRRIIMAHKRASDKEMEKWFE